MKRTAPRADSVSTGIDGLDEILDGLRIGDNVVWRVDAIEDYQAFVTPFVRAAQAAGRTIIYVRFAHHAPLVEAGPNVRIEPLDALEGFEGFTRHVWTQIEDWGRGAFYVFDCLSDLLSMWATDHMVGNFFRVICPCLYELDTVAYFALQPGRHSNRTLSSIRQTTQVLLDIHRVSSEVQLQPVKVWQRSSPTMFLPHHHRAGTFTPVTDSVEATQLQATVEQYRNGHSDSLLDYWDRLFLSIRRALSDGQADSTRRIRDQALRVLIGPNERMLALARQYLTLQDLLAIRSSMIGSGYIGGKALGMLLARAILLRQDAALWQRHLLPHDSVYLGSDVYYAFLVHNGLWPSFMRQRTQKGFLAEARTLRSAMLEGRIPGEVQRELERMLDHFGQYPILVRSSSLLEDGFGNAFAGKYDSVFLVNQGSPEERLAALEGAVRQVYASTMSEDALRYRQQRGLQDREEPMALLLQRVNGRYHGRYYFPDAAGVGVSRNTFVWDPAMNPAAGMLRLVVGLGTRAVDRIEGDHACVLALDYPLKRPFRNLDESYRFSQHQVDVLDIGADRLRPVTLQSLVAQAPQLPVDLLAEVDRQASERAQGQAVWRITFRQLLDRGKFTRLSEALLQTLESAYAHPVDIEFTLHFSTDGTPAFNLVQCRPLATLGEQTQVSVPQDIEPERVFFATRGHFMGGNMDLCFTRVITVDATAYTGLSVSQRHQLARLVGKLNCTAADATTLLMGPGRWGTSSPELGVPVRFSHISGVTVLAEVAEMGTAMVPDLSYGSHFFLDLVESRTGYVAIFPGERGTRYNPGWLRAHARLCRDEVLSVVDEEDAEVVAALSLWRPPQAQLRLVCDVTSQTLVCFGQGG